MHLNVGPLLKVDEDVLERPWEACLVRLATPTRRRGRTAPRAMTLIEERLGRRLTRDPALYG